MKNIVRAGLFVVLAAGLLLPSSGLALQKKKPGGDPTKKKKTEEVFKMDGKLTTAEPKDKIRKSCYVKTHDVKLEAGSNYFIELSSDDFDPYLRLEDLGGKILAQDDDAGGDFNALITFTPEVAGNYRVVVTTYTGRDVGAYKLKVSREIKK